MDINFYTLVIISAHVCKRKLPRLSSENFALYTIKYTNDDFDVYIDIYLPYLTSRNDGVNI
jgi:hypothetical protein